MDAFDWIGFSGLLVALAGWLYTWYVDRKVKTQEIALNEIQLKKWKEEDLSKKAIIEAYTYRTPATRYSKSGCKMKVYNKGKSSAKNIRIYSKDLNTDPLIQLNINDRLLPYPLLHPQASFEIIIFLCNGHAETLKIKFMWDDDYGSNQEREQILNL